MPGEFAAEELVALMRERIFVLFLEQVGLQSYIESGQLSGTA